MSKEDEIKKMRINSEILKIFPSIYKQEIQRNSNLAMKDMIKKSTLSNRK